MSDLIAAYSGGTPPCAIGIVRMTGDGCLETLKKAFFPYSPLEDKKMAYGRLKAIDGRTFDICMACFMKAPSTYTGEDMAEIYCHGSEAVIALCLKTLYSLGARPAEAGEFTKRAFLNGKMNLAQAEATADLIYSRSEQGAKNAAALLSGHYFKPIGRMRQEIMDTVSHFYAVCDYTDEDIDPFEYQKAESSFKEKAGYLQSLYQGYLRSGALSEGVKVALVGRPNAGKSSLFNRLAGFERAIVTNEEGTTRDVVGHTVSIGGKLFSLMDTAGIRQGQSEAERLGVQRSKKALDEAMLVIALFDLSRPVTHEDMEIAQMCRGKKAVAVFNKTDLPKKADVSELERLFEDKIYVSAAAGEGIGRLCQWLEENSGAGSDILITGRRQAELIKMAADSLSKAAESAAGGMTADAFLLDAEQAARLLGRVLGDDVDIDIAQGIFSRFCVGK